MIWKRRPLVAGAVTLFASGLLIRIISTLYRVVLVRVAGEDILGLYQLTLPIYRLGWTLATFGIPVAISQLSADATGRGNAYAALRLRLVGLRLTLIAALSVSLLLALSSDLLANVVLTDPRARIPLLVMPFLIIPSALCSALRGVVQGEQRMGPIAASNALEVGLRAPVVIYAVGIAAQYGTEWGAASVIFGLTVGELASLVLLIALARSALRLNTFTVPKLKRIHFAASDLLPYARRLLRLALPVLGSGLLNNLLGIFSVAIIPRRLGLAGLTMEEAVRAYGRLSGMAIPVLYMPMVVISPITSVLEPAVARYRAQRGTEAIGPLIRKAYLITASMSMLAFVAFLAVPEQLGKLLYGVSGLGELIIPLAAAAPFAYVGYITSSILYGLGRTGIVMINSAAGNLARLVLIWTLGSDPAWGIIGVTWAVVADYVISAALNIVSLPIALRRKPSQQP